MASVENNKILESARILERWENTPTPFEDPYSDMSDIEKSKLIQLLIEQRDDLKRLLEEMRQREENSSREKDALQKRVTELMEVSSRRMECLMNQICELTKLLKEKENENARLQSRLDVANRNKYARTSQKTDRSGKNRNEGGMPAAHTDAEDGFDGSASSLPQDMDVDSPAETSAGAGKLTREKEIRLYRQGKKYRTMKADNHVGHPSDRSLLPEGAEFIAFVSKYSYDQVTTVTEHCFQMIKYKDKDGKIKCGYFPANGDTPIIETVPGTHATAELLAHLVFNRFFLATPVYREKYRLMQEKMRVSSQTVSNWLLKGADFIKFIIEQLMEQCLVKDSIVNCDETWCRVKVGGEYRKKYIWCLVNKRYRIVIYRYEDGSRRRDILRHILGNSQIKALQTDGYAAYLYLDNEMLDIEHICCMAHVRAKFKYAAEIEHDENAALFLTWFGKLYYMEETYERQKLSPQEIKFFRNSKDTDDIKKKMKHKLDEMLSDSAPKHGDLMRSAVRYFDHFWTQVFRYQNDGEYTIDNNLAERFIRPLANERKNSLFFGSHKMARVSAAYHSVISTCKFHGISVLEYLKKFFCEIVAGNRDYQKLMPATIGINPNKY